MWRDSRAPAGAFGAGPSGTPRARLPRARTSTFRREARTLPREPVPETTGAGAPHGGTVPMAAGQGPGRLCPRPPHGGADRARRAAAREGAAGPGAEPAGSRGRKRRAPRARRRAVIRFPGRTGRRVARSARSRGRTG
ncbi:hypothetical protein Shyhy01_16310 [Streptomyces hygroscopicus subsp. hygroscopicus]|nr:hypothetical protein Shyhy01_16310 [Streptomyces hygroscopicus subsp. hygroscopicus]